MPELIDNEAMFYMVNSSGENVKKHLPLVYADNPEDAKKKLLDFIDRTLFKQSILYGIRDKNQPFPIGYIHIVSPLSPTGLNEWSVDFWMGEIAQGNGHMTDALNSMLEYMRAMQISTVKALVEIENKAAKRVLEKTGFVTQNLENGGKRILMSIEL